MLLFLAGPAWAANHTITLGNLSFSPNRITVQAGDTVTWVNTGGTHNVVAEDGSFTSGEIASADSPVWPYVVTFERPGVFPFFCSPHEFHGMRGVVEVSGPNHPGVFELGAPAFASEEGGSALVTVRRTRGQTGAVSVTYAAEAFSSNPGNATPGSDFTAVTGTLSWVDGEASDKSFAVPLLADSVVEGDEVLSLVLRSPSGGATLEPLRRSAVLTVTENGGSPACVESPIALCLNGGRFKAEVAWRIPNGTQGSGQAVPVPTAPDSGLFYFFDAGNIEMLVKVLNACPLNNRFWVFYAATTNVQLTLTVTDTQTGAVKVYFNPLNQAAAPIQDTSAFATCP